MSSQRTFPERLTALQRLGLSVGAGLCAFAARAAFDIGGSGFLVSWDAGASVYLVLAWTMIKRTDPGETRRHARSQDLAASVTFVTVLIAAFASVAAITVLLSGVKDLAPLPKAAHIVLSVMALVSSWLLVHTLYSFHYARRFYAELEGGNERRGLEFPGGADPDYFDFAYYSFVIGMTSQVSDVAVSGRHIRRITLVHGIMSFLFNVAVLALSVNIIVSVI